MEAEHCFRFDSDHQFTSSNYSVKTSPKKEWKIVIECDSSAADMSNHRVIPQIPKLMQLEVAKLSNVTDYEVVSVVMYTGPMVMESFIFSKF
jgi:hypothetical protein